MDKVIEKEMAPRGKMSKKTVLVIAGIVLLAALLVALGYYAWTANKKLKAMSDPKAQEEITKKEIKSYVAKLSRHIILPKDEEPTMATITDINALKKEQPFYDGASNGDVILIYTKAKLGFVYDPAKDIIVKTGPVYIDETKKETTTPTTTDNTKTIPTTTPSAETGTYDSYNQVGQ